MSEKVMKGLRLKAKELGIKRKEAKKFLYRKDK